MASNLEITSKIRQNSNFQFPMQTQELHLIGPVRNMSETFLNPLTNTHSLSIGCNKFQSLLSSAVKK